MTLSGMNLSDESEDEIENIDPYRRKYQLLSERCEVLQQDNERLAFRIQQVRRQRRRARKLRKAIMDHLDKHGDGWRSVPLIIPDPAARTTVKVEKSSPKSSPGKGAPTPKANNPSKNAGSDKSSSKAHKTSASGSTPKRKSTPKGDKPERDPNAPKRPINPFFVFCSEQHPHVMEQLAEQRPGETELSQTDINKHLLAKWNSLNADERKIYYTIYEKSKEKYMEDMVNYKKEKMAMAMANTS